MELTECGLIDETKSMYPSYSELVQDGIYQPPMCATTYGVVWSGMVQRKNVTWEKGEYFSLTGTEPFEVDGTAWFVSRIGFQGQNMTGHEIEENGRLTYIDNCSSTILVYPPRYGDPSLHLLAFPPRIDQSFHTHPSIRIGLVYSGRGLACLANESLELKPGMMFCLREQELHRFRTLSEPMRVIAYHPDGNWGPTDEVHPMLNRTYIMR